MNALNLVRIAQESLKMIIWKIVSRLVIYHENEFLFYYFYTCLSFVVKNEKNNKTKFKSLKMWGITFFSQKSVRN